MKMNNKIVTGLIGGTSFKEKYYHAFFYRGFCKMQMTDWASAKTDFDVCIGCDKDGIDGYAFYYRGICLVNLGDHSKGCLDFSRGGEVGCEDAYDALKAYCK